MVAFVSDTKGHCYCSPQILLQLHRIDRFFNSVLLNFSKSGESGGSGKCSTRIAPKHHSSTYFCWHIQVQWVPIQQNQENLKDVVIGSIVRTCQNFHGESDVYLKLEFIVFLYRYLYRKISQKNNLSLLIICTMLLIIRQNGYEVCQHIVILVNHP